MTLQTNPLTASPDKGRAHLTEEQFGDLLTSSPASDAAMAAVQAHLLVCDRCAAEFASLRESVALFREASTAFADSEFQRLRPISRPARSIFSPALSPTYWVAAAAALFLAAILPMQSLRQHSVRTVPAVAVRMPATTAQSDEALLDDVDRYTSASVPSPMQALADPTGTTSSTAETSNSTSNQRKD